MSAECSLFLSEIHWCFSENYIFGKFDAFCKRLEKLNDMLATIDNLSKLPSVKIEVWLWSFSFMIHLSIDINSILLRLWSLKPLCLISVVFLKGIEPISMNYQTIVSTVKKKSYDVLDHRKSEVCNLLLTILRFQGIKS